MGFFENINTSHAFEVFTLFFSDGESKSLNHMLSMYERTFDLKTFF